MSKLFMTLVLAAPMVLAAPSGNEPQQLDLCTLVANWQKFSGKLIRVKALFQEGAEQSALSDPACRNGERLVFVSPRAHVDGKKGRLRRILRKDRHAEVVLEGVFRGPELAPIDPKLPESMKEKLKGSKLRYGHLGSFDMMIEVTKIVEAEKKGKE
jgi:hypothetical protein